MDGTEKLRSMIADSLGVDASTITDGFSLNVPRFRSSAGSVILGNMVKKACGRTVGCKGVSTFGELVARAEGKDAAETDENAGGTAPAESPGQLSPSRDEQERPVALPASGLVCGVDIQETAIFPQADDYWTDSFYTDNFTPDEIAYCVAADSPRHSFAARWCLKEALHKTGPRYYNIPLRDIQAVRLTDGTLRLQIRGTDGNWQTLPFACSASHADSYAVGMVTGII